MQETDSDEWKDFMKRRAEKIPSLGKKFDYSWINITLIEELIDLIL